MSVPLQKGDMLIHASGESGTVLVLSIKTIENYRFMRVLMDGKVRELSSAYVHCWIPHGWELVR